MDTASSSAKIILSCDQCGKRLSVGSNLAGKSVKCACGHVLKVPANAVGASKSAQTTSPTNPASKQPVSPKSAKPSSLSAAKDGSKQTVAAPKAPPAPAPPAGSFLDQLTEADFKRPPINPYAVDNSHKSNDAAILRKYSGTAEKLAEENKTANGNIIFLAVLHLIGAIVYLGLSVVLLVFMGVIARLGDVMPLAALGGIFAAVTFVFGLFDLLAGVGLLMRKSWGWWLCQIGLGWCIFDRLAAILLNFLLAQNWMDGIPKAIGGVLFIMSNVYFLSFFCKKSTMKMFKVNVHPGVVWGIAIGVGLLLGGATFGVSYTAAKSVAGNAAAPNAP